MAPAQTLSEKPASGHRSCTGMGSATGGSVRARRAPGHAAGGCEQGHNQAREVPCEAAGRLGQFGTPPTPGASPGVILGFCVWKPNHPGLLVVNSENCV